MTPAQGSLSVRRREDTDLPALGQVLVQVHQADGYPVEGVSDPKGWLQPEGEMAAWTALQDDHPIGHVSLTAATASEDAAQVWLKEADGSLDDIAVVARLFVDPEHRGRGAGLELMRAAHQHASGAGRRLVFDVMLKDQRAISLYEALGCKRLGLITHHHSDGLEEPAAVYVAPEQTTTRLS